MTNEEKFALTQSIEVLKLKMKDFFGYIRSDYRGDNQRGKLAELQNQIDLMIKFIESTANK